MKKVFSLLLVILLSNWAVAQITDYSIFDKKFNFYVANDLGRNGYYDQKPIAELMGTMAEEIGPEFVVATGDIHHFEGVRSVNDPLWMTNYELIYSHPELMIDWFPVLNAVIITRVGMRIYNAVELELFGCFAVGYRNLTKRHDLTGATQTYLGG